MNKRGLTPFIHVCMTGAWHRIFTVV
jgi:hypothetical protein